MERRLDRIMGHIFDCPLLIAPDQGEVIARVIMQRVSSGRLLIESMPELLDEVPAAELNRFYGTTKRSTRESGLSSLIGRTAIVSINGELVNRGAWIGSSSGLVSYEGLAVQLKDVMNDPEVQNVIIDANSPGGEAAGIEAAADAIRQLNAVKPVIVHVNSNAMSGMYWLASQAKDIWVSPSSNIGSIGVVVYHLDRSAQLADDGIKVTTIKAGAHKADFSSLGPLSKEAAERLQGHVDEIYDRFCSAVASGRGKRLTVEAARATEALIYSGEQAVKAGLADRVGSFDELLTELNQEASARPASSMPLATGGKSAVKTESGAKTGPNAMSDDVKAANEKAVKIMKACNAAGVPNLAAGFIEAGTSLEDVEKRVAECAQIREAVKSAAAVTSTIDPKLADQFIINGASITHVNSQLLKMIGEAGPKENIRSAHDARPAGGEHGAPTEHAEIQQSWKTALKGAGAFAHERPVMQKIKMR